MLVQKILKFGGSSLDDKRAVRNIIKIVKENIEKDVTFALVLSAFKGVTNRLISISELAASNDSAYKTELESLKLFHVNKIKLLVAENKQNEITHAIDTLFIQLGDLLQGVYYVNEVSEKILDSIQSFGELCSARIMTACLQSNSIGCDYLDARRLIKTNSDYSSARILKDLSYKNIQEYFQTCNNPQIITGFIGSTKEGYTTTLGRSGSDFTASVIAAALDASLIEIWTDVDGVMAADPRKVSNAFVLKSLSYEEALELSHFGAKVIHPATMQPALDAKIPILIKNSFNPEAPGTIINETGLPIKRFVKGISSIDDIALINVQGSGMVGVAGIAYRIFSATSRKAINVILISQASSEHSVCFAVQPQFAELAKEEIEKELRLEITDRVVSQVSIETGLSVIAIVGEKMRKNHGIAGRIFHTLGENGVNIVAIAQGASELNISIVVNKKDLKNSLEILHDSFFNHPVHTMNVFILGTGSIGKGFIQQIQKQRAYLLKTQSLKINICGLSNSRNMLIGSKPINQESIFSDIELNGKPADLKTFIAKMKRMNLPNSICIDCTASDKLTEMYESILSDGISIATANKRGAAGSYEYYKTLKSTALQNNVKFHYEANVGAGLPVISMIQNLQASGDRIHKIEGVLSGTLSYIFNNVSSEKSLSETINEAQERGFTEPDPREDLNGLDVARKALILAREMGLSLELKDVKIDKVLPDKILNTDSSDDFKSSLEAYNEEFEKNRKESESQGKKLRYIAEISGEGIRVSLREIDSTHSLWDLGGSDIMLAIESDYCMKPLVIRGPGAGANITASGVFADLIRIAHKISY